MNQGPAIWGTSRGIATSGIVTGNDTADRE
jgi:hypothetical protein